MGEVVNEEQEKEGRKYTSLWDTLMEFTAAAGSAVKADLGLAVSEETLNPCYIFDGNALLCHGQKEFGSPYCVESFAVIKEDHD